MFDQPSMGQRVARAAAIVCSLGLFAFVVVNAQLGCDSPTSNPPAQGDAAAQPKPQSQPQPGPATANEPTPAQVDPAAPAPIAAPSTAADPKPSEPDTDADAAKPEPVFMPASKSGGDFGSMRFPGEKPEQAQQAQQAQQQNPAPNPR